MNLDNDKPYIITVPNVMSAIECTDMIDRIEAAGPETATINTATGTRVVRSVRNNDRVIFDDEPLASLLFERIEGEMPEEIHGMSICGVNERFRCYRYLPGMRFAPHADSAFHRNENEQSWYSFLIYLNEVTEGGSTTFIVRPEVSIQPETGSGLLFQHEIIHEGCEVKAGKKYVLRSDVMYRSTSP